MTGFMAAFLFHVVPILPLWGIFIGIRFLMWFCAVVGGWISFVNLEGNVFIELLHLLAMCIELASFSAACVVSAVHLPLAVIEITRDCYDRWRET